MPIPLAGRLRIHANLIVITKEAMFLMVDDLLLKRSATQNSWLPMLKQSIELNALTRLDLTRGGVNNRWSQKIQSYSIARDHLAHRFTLY